MIETSAAYLDWNNAAERQSAPQRLNEAMAKVRGNGVR